MTVMAVHSVYSIDRGASCYVNGSRSICTQTYLLYLPCKPLLSLSLPEVYSLQDPIIKQVVLPTTL